MKGKLAVGTMAIAVALACADAALAQECTTRAKVKAELAEAIRTNSILSGDSSLYTDIAPSGYLAKLATSAPSQTREQVEAELAKAVHTDSILSGDGSFYADIAPSGYLAELATSAPSKTQEQVEAELAEAIRTDSILSGDSSLYTEIAPSGDLATPVNAGTNVASTNCSPDRPVAAASDRSIDVGSSH